jgi:hypothetical protein
MPEEDKFRSGRKEVVTVQPRKPTEEEKEQLIHYVREHQFPDPMDENRETVPGYVERASIAVFDDYITDNPGYYGKIMMVIWSSGPVFYNVYIWVNGEIAHQKRDM